MSFSLQGLASGLNTADIIKGLMDVERVPYTNLETRKSQLQTQQAVFRQLNTKLNTLQSAASEMQYHSTFEKNTASLSKSGVLTATATDVAMKGKYEINVTQLAQTQVTGLAGIKFSSDAEVKQFKDAVFHINGETINIASLGTDEEPIDSNEKALKALVSQINSATDTYGGKASLIDTDGMGNYTLSISALSADKIVNFSFSGVTPPIIDPLTDEESDTLSSTQLQAAQVAKLNINGIEVSRPTNEIKDLIQGVTLNLSTVDKTTLTVNRDNAAITASADKFVNAYNDLMDTINRNLAKPADESLTNPLQGDSVLRSLKDTLYGLFTSIIPADKVNDGSGKPGMMEQIGFSIDKNVSSGSQMTGKITFDKAIFSAALAENADKVANMFTDRAHAVWTTMSGSFAGATSGIIASKITGYDSQIKSVDDRLEALDRSLLMKEERMKKQFNSMEVMLSSLYNQQNWLASQFNSLMNNSGR